MTQSIHCKEGKTFASLFMNNFYVACITSKYAFLSEVHRTGLNAKFFNVCITYNQAS